jgi:hypothetical protein
MDAQDYLATSKCLPHLTVPHRRLLQYSKKQSVTQISVQVPHILTFTKLNIVQTKKDSGCQRTAYKTNVMKDIILWYDVLEFR